MDTIIQTDNGKAVREISSASVPAYLTALAKRPDVGHRGRQALVYAASFTEDITKQGHDMGNIDPITHETLSAYLRNLSTAMPDGRCFAFIHAAEIIADVSELGGEF